MSKSAHFFVWAILCCAAVSSCQFFDTGLRTSEIRPVMDAIIDRHDGYVVDDVFLSTEQKNNYLNDSVIITHLMMENKSVKAETLYPYAIPLCERHDEYVIIDPKLNELQKRTALRSSELIVATIKENIRQ